MKVATFFPLVSVSVHRAQEFLSVPLNQFLPLPFFATVAVFGFSHNDWLAGLLYGAAYQWLEQFQKFCSRCTNLAQSKTSRKFPAGFQNPATVLIKPLWCCARTAWATR